MPDRLSTGPGTARLENAFLALDIETACGRITGLLNKKTGWQVIRQPALAMGLRMVVPIENHRNNRVLGESQRLSDIRVIDGTTARLRWDSLTGDKSGKLDISVEASIELRDAAITFSVNVINGSPHTVEEIWYPCFGGLRGPAEQPDLYCRSLNMVGGITESVLGDDFSDECGYWGVDHPTMLRGFPGPAAQVPFELLDNGVQGLYLGEHNPHPDLVLFVHELKPGYLDSKHRRVAPGDTIGEHPAGFCVSVARMPFLPPGERCALAPVVVAAYEGDWHRGIEPYRAYRSQWYRPLPRPAWNDDIDCWMTLHINSPEGCCRYLYSELPEIMREARDSGVQALQLIGWARDGQDGAEPYQDTDPRLGSAEDLRKAIADIEALGVRVILMCKFKWCDGTVPQYAAELMPLTAKSMHGLPVYFGGYAYQTLAQHMGGGSRRVGAALCHGSPALHALALREFGKILSLRPSGILYDELQNCLTCFDPTHGHRPGAAMTRGSLELAGAFHAAAERAYPEGFLFAGEGPCDHVSQIYSVNYIRSWDRTWHGGRHIPAWKYLDPGMQTATCVTGFDDREMINQCVTYGYIINYEPFNFKGRLSDFPATVDYGRKAQRLRRRLWDYLWRGRFRHTDGASVKPAGCNGAAEHIYSVFDHASGGKSAVVIANQDFRNSLPAVVILNGRPDAQFDLYSIEHEEVTRCAGRVTVPPRSLVVLVEQ